jgi:hypothetical protein
MPLPLIWVIVAAGGYVASHLLQEGAKQKEKDARELDEIATRMAQEAIEIFDVEAQTFQDSCNRQRMHIEAVYAECRERADPIFQHFATGPDEMASWPMPPHFSPVQQIPIPDRPPGIPKGDVEYYRVLSGETAEKKMSDALRHGCALAMTSRNSTFVSPTAAGVMGSALALTTSIDRYTDAARAGTTATERLSEAGKLVTQLEGHTIIFAALKRRAEALATKVDSMKPFFDRYRIPSQELYASGKTRSELDTQEWRTIQYLGQVFVCLTKVCNQPLI